MTAVSISQLIEQANHASSMHAQAMRERSVRPPRWKLIYHLMAKPLMIFWDSYVRHRACRDGLAGLVMSLLTSWSHWLTWAKYWELDC